MRVEPSHKRVRAFLGGVLVVDSDDALYVWERPWYPQYYLPLADVTDGVLERSPRTEASPDLGTARYYTVRAGDREAVDAAWSYEDGPVEKLRGLVRFEWGAMDAWFEEDEEVFGHPRNPSTRVQILRSSRHVVVSVDGVVIAESDRPTFLHETGLVRRTYLPKVDVRMDLLIPTATLSICPYKGTASYWSVRVNDHVHADLAWSYAAPFHESAHIAGLIAFYDERVELTVDRQRRALPEPG